MSSFSLFQEYYNMITLWREGITNIPQPYFYIEVERADQTPFFVMEKLPGGDLDEVITERYEEFYDDLTKTTDPDRPLTTLRYNYIETKEFILQLLNFLSAMFKMNMVHCDLKLDNMHFDRSNKKLTILDFGLSKRDIDVFKKPLDRSEWIGTITYLPFEFRIPKKGGNKKERVRIETQSTWEKNEIWCAGICIYRFISLTYPFISLLPNGQPDPANIPITLSDDYYLKHYKPNSCWDRINDETIPNRDWQTLLRGMLNPVPFRRWGVKKCLDYIS